MTQGMKKPVVPPVVPFVSGVVVGAMVGGVVGATVVVGPSVSTSRLGRHAAANNPAAIVPIPWRNLRREMAGEEPGRCR